MDNLLLSNRLGTPSCHVCLLVSVELHNTWSCTLNQWKRVAYWQMMWILYSFPKMLVEGMGLLLLQEVKKIRYKLIYQIFSFFFCLSTKAITISRWLFSFHLLVTPNYSEISLIPLFQLSIYNTNTKFSCSH